MTKRVSKKFISILLALVSIMAVFSTCVTANAAAQVYNIDTSKKASLTLYKYEMADASTATAVGTGEITDQTNVPADAKPLSDVTFTIYKISTLNNYFKPDGVKLPTADEAKAMITKSTPKFNAVTNTSGIASFKNLDLGIYYVEETDGPAQITKDRKSVV